MLPISSSSGITPVGQPGSAGVNKANASQSNNPFSQLLSQANADQHSSDQAIRELASGESDNVQQVVMQVVKAEMSFQLFMEVRNQLIESYNELMRMQF
ncbi:MAG: flagellar hook-basal body complex protein FliE [bacterium]|nr:flagellar hook-basal body complex protein FliE [bacterium]